jgi:hypothetical protein
VGAVGGRCRWALSVGAVGGRCRWALAAFALAVARARVQVKRARSVGGWDPCAPPFADRPARATLPGTATGDLSMSTQIAQGWRNRAASWPPDLAGAAGLDRLDSLSAAGVTLRVSNMCSSLALVVRSPGGAVEPVFEPGPRSRSRSSQVVSSSRRLVSDRSCGARVVWVVMSGLDVSEGDVSWCVGSVTPCR